MCVCVCVCSSTYSNIINATCDAYVSGDMEKREVAGAEGRREVGLAEERRRVENIRNVEKGDAPLVYYIPMGMRC